MHQFVVHSTHSIVLPYRHLRLSDYRPLVYFVIQQEGRHARTGLAVDYGPVYRSGTAILRQKRGVQVERPVTRHGPYHLGQHAESYHNTQIGL